MPLSTRDDKELYMMLDTLLDSAFQILLHRNKHNRELDKKARLRLEHKLRHALKAVRVLISRHGADAVVNLKWCEDKDHGSESRSLSRRNWRKYKRLNEHRKCRPITDYL